MPIVLLETVRALFEAPFYAALTRNAFDHAGVDVTFKPAAEAADAAVRAVLTGEVDAAWGGPMRVIREHDRDSACDLVCFCEVVTRDPFCLVGARPRNDFRLADLRDLRIGAVREAPTAWLTLQDDLRRSGLDPSRLTVSLDRSMADNAVGLRTGQLDVIQTLEPYVEELVSEQAGYIWYAAADRGLTAYTCLYARRPVVAQRRHSFESMTYAMHQTQRWLHASSARELAKVVAPYFAGVPPARLSAAIARYKRCRIWATEPHVTRIGYERLQAALLSANFIRTQLPFKKAVDNSLAVHAMSSALGSGPQQSSAGR